MSADEMFKKLDYKPIDKKDILFGVWGVSYINDKKYIEITFDFEDCEICIGTAETNGEPVYIGMQELQAINQKCKELGWLDENNN